MILEKINKPNDIKKLSPIEYEQLADEIRQFLLEKISVTGGHLASNLGVVELTMALHIVFNLPSDKLIWDVGHQSYTHKILTGRKNQFDGLRKFGGMSGFPKRNESNYDAFDTGHSSTSISAGLGYVAARDISNEHYNVISVIGDGALTGGMAYEALNNASQVKSNFIIVLNDNTMSISKNVGGVSKMLSDIRSSDSYYDLKEGIANTLYKFPNGQYIVDKIKKTKSNIKQFIVPNQIFETMGISYLGPVDGHDTEKLIKIFNIAKRMDHAVLVHVVTQKGHGYKPAERNPSKFHGIGPFDIATGKEINKSAAPTYSDVFSEAICSLAKKDNKITAVTAAMPDGTGLAKFSKWFPDRFFDVGIAEAHAVTFSAGMAAGGMKPVFAVYSSFLQRAYDQILHDVCIQQLHVVFAIDRAGLVGSDGETHQGIFDMSFLTSIPNMTLFAPKNGKELKQALHFALEEYNGPIGIRYPRGKAVTDFEEFDEPIVYGRSEYLYKEDDIALLAVGNMVTTAAKVREKLKEKGYNATLVNVRFVKPIDEGMVIKVCQNHKLVVTLEENVITGGFGEAVSQFMEEKKLDNRLLNIALPDDYIEHGSVDILKCEAGIDTDTVFERIITVRENI
ncbi:MAG: 1-deoxy-D-xylulose-5-phosphate synthase [Lachnospira sp.]|nr:1-deoxy-D-xylulose-5-phosphate synthase [Lachnospira sp.]MDD5829087.1 1-deoxy-D-xylulose-5-phosphate synthase [Lachnospira sp.]